MPTISKDAQVLECLQQGTDWTVDELAAQTGISTKTVRKHLKILVEHGLVGVEGNLPTRYFAKPV
jgi:predicted ArsR family transcriptional regulator